MNDIPTISSDDLALLFDASLPAPSRLSSDEARVAILMHRAGQDAVAIAQRLDLRPSDVRPLVQRLKAAEAAKARNSEAPRRSRWAILTPAHADDPEPSVQPAESTAAIIPFPAPQAPAPVPEPPASAPPPPDVALSPMQRALVRKARALGLPVSAISRTLRLSVDQVQRECGEAP